MGDRPTISMSCSDDPSSKETFQTNWNNARPCAFFMTSSCNYAMSSSIKLYMKTAQSILSGDSGS